MAAKKKTKKSTTKAASAKKVTTKKVAAASAQPALMHSPIDHLPTPVVALIIGGIFLVIYLLYTYAQNGML